MRYEKMYGSSIERLRKSTIVLMLLIALFVGSCKVKKTEQQTQREQQVEQKNDLLIECESESRRGMMQRGDSRTKTDEIVEEIIEEIEWSVPDSVGRQYPTSTRTVSRTNQKRQHVDRTRQAESVTHWIERQTTEATCEQTTEERQESVVEEEEKIRTPLWLVAFIVGIVAVVGIIIYLFLKRYRIL